MLHYGLPTRQCDRDYATGNKRRLGQTVLVPVWTILGPPAPCRQDLGVVVAVIPIT